MDTAQAVTPAQAIEDVARPGGDRAAAIRALRSRLAEIERHRRARERAEHLVDLAVRCGSHRSPPWQARHLLGVDRGGLRDAARPLPPRPRTRHGQSAGPESTGPPPSCRWNGRAPSTRWCTAARRSAASAGASAGPTCMFRRHSCDDRVAGARRRRVHWTPAAPCSPPSSTRCPTPSRPRCTSPAASNRSPNPGLGELAARAAHAPRQRSLLHQRVRPHRPHPGAPEPAL